MQRKLISALAITALGMVVGVTTPPASASTLCLYPGMSPTWTTDIATGTVTYTLDTDQNGLTVVKVQAPDGTTTTQTIAPCGPGTTAYLGPVVSISLPPPVVAVPVVPYFPHHHRHW